MLLEEKLRKVHKTRKKYQKLLEELVKDENSIREKLGKIKDKITMPIAMRTEDIEYESNQEVPEKGKAFIGLPKGTNFEYDCFNGYEGVVDGNWVYCKLNKQSREYLAELERAKQEQEKYRKKLRELDYMEHLIRNGLPKYCR